MGVRISLDDFGTGYSSLSYLHSFPLDKVKIDRSFLQGVGTGHRPLNLLRGVARLSAELGMSVAVEGIETEEQLDLIAREKSVDEVQGFLFSPAIPSSDIRNMLYLRRPPASAKSPDPHTPLPSCRRNGAPCSATTHLGLLIARTGSRAPLPTPPPPSFPVAW